MEKKHFVLFVFVLGFALSIGIHVHAGSNPPQVQVQSKNAIGQLLDAFKTYKRDVFAELIDDKFTPDKYEFINNVERTATRIRVISIDYFIEKDIKDKDRVSVEFKWHMSYIIQPSGEPVLKEGRCNAVFVVRDGGLFLQSISEDNPFVLEL